MMPQFNTNVARDISYHAFGPALQMLRVKEPWNQAVTAQTCGFCRQLNRWGSSNLHIGCLGPFESVILSEEEGAAIYAALDRIFAEVFPDLAGMTRPETAAHIQGLVDDVHSALVERFPNGPDEMQRASPAYGKFSESCEFLRLFLGKSSLLLEEIELSPVPA